MEDGWIERNCLLQNRHQVQGIPVKHNTHTNNQKFVRINVLNDYTYS